MAQSISPLERNQLFSDLTAGVIVAVMLVPQAMAYAMLAGLPPQMGLYASIVPLILYSIFGSSNALAVGPVAMVSLLVASGLRPLAEAGSEAYLQLALTLTLLIALLHLIMACLRLGFLVSLISHPVLLGFTNAAAIVIGFSQVKHLFGTQVTNTEYPLWQIYQTIVSLPQLNPATLLVGVGGLAILLWFNFCAAPWLHRLGLPIALASSLAKLGPLVAVVTAVLITWLGNLNEARGVSIVGPIPSGLPSLTRPVLELQTIRQLLPLALVITLIGYVESISVAKVLANLRKEKINPNRELVGLGAANLGAALNGGLPVTGGFSRSMVNHAAGVSTRWASVVTAVIVGMSVIFLTSLFYFIPHSVLAAIIVVAVMRLIDLKAPVRLWRYCREDALAFGLTFGGVLCFGIEFGILLGIATTFLMLLYRQSRPHIAVVGRVGKSEHFRNYLRHPVELEQGVLMVRLDESLNFINAKFFENHVMDQIGKHAPLRAVLLIAQGVNDIDSTGIDTLQELQKMLALRDIQFFLSDVKGPVLDRLTLAEFDASFLKDHIFLSAHEALQFLLNRTAPVSPESALV
jgi:sulfate permease, SulP family